MAVLSWGRASKAGRLLDPTCPEHPQLQPGSPGRRIPAQVPPSGQRAPGGESVGGRPSVGGVKVRGLPAQNTPGKERVRGAARLIRQAPGVRKTQGLGCAAGRPQRDVLICKGKSTSDGGFLPAVSSENRSTTPPRASALPAQPHTPRCWPPAQPSAGGAALGTLDARIPGG